MFALNFVFLFNNGTEALLPGLLAVIPGALLVAFMAICGKQVDITIVQRWLLVITVLSCLLMPFSDGSRAARRYLGKRPCDYSSRRVDLRLAGVLPR